MEEEIPVSELCRMCLSDLSEVIEYYTIDGEVQSLISELVFKVSFFLVFCKFILFILTYFLNFVT